MRAHEPDIEESRDWLLDTAVVLAGGKGTRLQPATKDEIAKPAVLVSGRPFVDFVLEQLEEAGVSRVLIALGHRAETLTQSLRLHGRSRIAWEPYVESEPLGTAGALVSLTRTLPDEFLVVNGDTLVDGMDLNALLAFHRARRSALTLALAEVSSAEDYGTVVLDKSGRVVEFQEKGGSCRGLVNCGLYVASRQILRFVGALRPASVERDLIPSLLRRGAGVHGYPFQGRFYDIGTPERLREFVSFAEARARSGGRSG